MNFFISENMKVDKVVDGGAHVSVKIPVDVVDDILVLVDCIIHVSRLVRTKARVCVATNTHLPVKDGEF
jgi:hypothetical protein